MKYLLPCEHCGEKTPIEASQAGREIVCKCGAALQVPSFRAVRELEPFDEPQAPRRRTWNPVRGALFAAGLIIVVLGLLIAAGGGRGLAQLDTTKPPTQDLHELLSEMDTMKPVNAWEVWVDMRDKGLGPYFPPPYLQAQVWAKRYRGMLIVGLVVIALGAATAASPLFVTGNRPGTRRR